MRNRILGTIAALVIVALGVAIFALWTETKALRESAAQDRANQSLLQQQVNGLRACVDTKQSPCSVEDYVN